MIRSTTLVMSVLAVGAAAAPTVVAQPVAFAENGSLKMLYDNRMYPQAVEHSGKIHIVWRGEAGRPFVRTYDPGSRRFSEPWMLLKGLDLAIDAAKLARDHHFAPVIWADPGGRLHVLFGCHGKPGVHLVSTAPGSITGWERAPDIATSISYPKIHRIAGDRTLVYFRDGGHLSSWTWRTSSDGGRSWVSPAGPVVDLNAEPQDGHLASHAGSYHTTKVSRDGRTLHIAFIWKVEEPVRNSRYNAFLDDHTQRYNLYYLKVDLASGKAFNYSGKQLRTPVNKGVADRDCLVWDTEQRVAAVGPSICLGADDEPYFLLPVSQQTPHRCRFYFVSRRAGGWAKTAIAETSHPFNASHLERTPDGDFRAFLITGEGETVSEEDMDSYGWGARVEEWVSDRRGDNWEISTDLTPIPGLKYQNIQFVSQDMREAVRGMILFYGWKDAFGQGTAYLWDGRR